jgi:hypothetical protein
VNERIRQLAEQARQYAESKVHLTGWNYIAEYNEKFAQLIVQECGVALSPMLRDMISRGQAVELIKKH